MIQYKCKEIHTKNISKRMEKIVGYIIEEKIFLKNFQQQRTVEIPIVSAIELA